MDVFCQICGMSSPSVKVSLSTGLARNQVDIKLCPICAKTLKLSVKIEAICKEIDKLRAINNNKIRERNTPDLFAFDGKVTENKF